MQLKNSLSRYLLSSLVSDLVPDKRGQFSFKFIHTADH